MIHLRIKSIAIALACGLFLASCSGLNTKPVDPDRITPDTGRQSKSGVQSGTSLLDVFKGKDAGVKVNRYLWTATLDVLNFLPVQNADPFTGVISTGYGRPPGGGRAYRATVLISDPALDARSLNVALQSSGGAPVSAGTQRAVEDAILSRARQLRIQAGKY